MFGRSDRAVIRMVAAVGIASSLGASSCGDSILGLDDDGAQSVRVALSVPEGEGGSVTYTSSNEFTVMALQDRVEIRLLESDTTASNLPLEANFATGARRQFVFLVTDRSAVAGTILLQVWLDDRLSLQQEFPLDGDDLVFLYLFGSGLVLQDLEVV